MSDYLLSQTFKSLPFDNNGYSRSLKTYGIFDNDNAFWCATPKGLVKYVNDLKLVYPYAKNDSIKDETITVMSSNLIWSSTNEIIFFAKHYGIYRFNIKTLKGTWTSLPEEVNYFNHVFEDNRENIWFSSKFGFSYKLNLNTNNLEKLVITQIYYDDIKQNYLDKIKTIYDLYKVYKLKDLIIFQKGNRFFYFKDGKSFEYFIDSKFIRHTEKSRNKIFIADESDFWTYKFSSSYIFKGKTHKVIYDKDLKCYFVEFPGELFNFFEDQYLKLDIIDSDNTLNKSYGYKFLGSKDNTIYFYELINDNGVYELILSRTLYADKNIDHFVVGELDLLILTGVDIQVINLKSLIFEFLLNSEDDGFKIVRPMLENRFGDKFIQTNKGLFQIKDNGKVSLLSLKATSKQKYILNYAYDMILDGHIIWAVFSDYLLKVDLKKQKIEHLSMLEFLENEPKNFKTNFQYIEKLSSNKILLSCPNLGLFEYNINTKKLLKRKFLNSIRVNAVYHMDSDKQGKFWITTNNGVFQFDSKFNVHEHITFPDEKEIPKHIFFNSENELYLTCHSNALVNYNLSNHNYKIDTYFKNNNQIIAGIVTDKKNVWVSTYNGLYHYNEQRPNIKAYYNTQNGLIENEFNTNSFLKTQGDGIFFGGMNGIVKVNEFDENDLNSLKIKLENAELYESETNKRRINDADFSSKSLKLKIPENNIKLSLSTNIGLSESENQRFLYRNLKKSDEWYEVNGGNYLTINGLSKGENKLQIKAQYGNEESNILNYSIKVTDVFYKENWFLAITIIIVLSSFLLLFLLKEKQRKLIHKTNLTVKTLELQSLISQMNPHFLHNTINNLQRVLLSSKPKVINDYFEAFAVILRHTLKMSKINRVTLSDEIEYLSSFLLISKMRLNNELKFKINYNLPEQTVSNIKVPSLIIQPIIENSIIHGLKPKQGEKKITVNFKSNKSSLIVEVIDNGVGRAAAKEIQENSIIKYNSLSSNILKQRLSLINMSGKNFIFFKIIDLTPKNNNSYGTKAIIEFRNIIKNNKS